MRKTILFAWATSGLLLAGCADHATLPGPSPRALPGAPIGRSESEGPAEVRNYRSQMQWVGRTASAYARMDYFGNRAWQTLNIQVIRGFSMVGSSPPYTDPAAHLLAGWNAMGTALRYTVASTCGQQATVYTEHGAAISFPLTGGFVIASSDKAPSEAGALQPACTSGSGGTCEEDLESTEESWSSPYPRNTCDGTTTGGGSGGSTGQPVDETWVEEFFGVRFRCTRSADPDFEVVTCVAEDEESEVQ